MLEAYIRERQKSRDILLMTHIVIGYRSFDESMRVVEEMVRAGVDLMELQIPFSEPMADGPVILQANAEALAAGATVDKCMDFAAEVTRRFDIPFLFMTYYNIVHQYGVRRFADAMAQRSIRGCIVADLPPEEGEEYLAAMRHKSLDPIFIFAPTSTPQRMSMLDKVASGFVYCVARKGVTGSTTDFGLPIEAHLRRCREATDLPLAVGFGVRNRSDVNFLRGKADIAVVGSATIRLIESKGVEAVAPFIEALLGVESDVAASTSRK